MQRNMTQGRHVLNSYEVVFKNKSQNVIYQESLAPEYFCRVASSPDDPGIQNQPRIR